MKVQSNDGAWTLECETDFDGPLPLNWYYEGRVFPYDPPPPIRRELEDKAWLEFHGRDVPDPDEYYEDHREEYR